MKIDWFRLITELAAKHNNSVRRLAISMGRPPTSLYSIKNSNTFIGHEKGMELVSMHSKQYPDIMNLAGKRVSHAVILGIA